MNDTYLITKIENTSGQVVKSHSQINPEVRIPSWMNRQKSLRKHQMSRAGSTLRHIVALAEKLVRQRPALTDSLETVISYGGENHQSK